MAWSIGKRIYVFASCWTCGNSEIGEQRLRSTKGNWLNVYWTSPNHIELARIVRNLPLPFPDHCSVTHFFVTNIIPLWNDVAFLIVFWISSSSKTESPIYFFAFSPIERRAFRKKNKRIDNFTHSNMNGSDITFYIIRAWRWWIFIQNMFGTQWNHIRCKTYFNQSSINIMCRVAVLSAGYENNPNRE